jgi:hypothetical protein
MRTRRPDKRSIDLRAAVAAGAASGLHPTDAAYCAFVATGSTEDPEVAHACEIANNEYEAEILNAFMLANASDEQLELHLRIPRGVSVAYRRLFFDVSHFRDELDIYSWVRELEETRAVSKHAVTLLKQAMQTGVDGLLWIYSRVKQPIDPTAVIQEVLVSAYMRAKQYKSADIKSAASREAHTHMNTAMKAASTLIQQAASTGNASGVSELLIKLGHRELTTSIEESDNKDILN